jgi:hypothetical protein
MSFPISRTSDSAGGMSRYDLTDFEWRVIERLLPNKPRGIPRVGGGGRQVYGTG